MPTTANAIKHRAIPTMTRRHVRGGRAATIAPLASITYCYLRASSPCAWNSTR